MAKKSSINPFAVATKPVATKSKSDVIVANAVIDGGDIVFPREQVTGAIESYANGYEMLNEGKSMMETNRPVIEAFAYQAYCDLYIDDGRKPENPRITTKADGTGITICASFIDRQINLNDDEFVALSNLIGADVAEASVEKHPVFSLKNDVLEQEITIKDDKKKLIKCTVMEAVIEALQVKFVDHPDIISSLIDMKQVFRTAKGLIFKGLQVIEQCPASEKNSRLQEYLKTIKAPISLKVTE